MTPVVARPEPRTNDDEIDIEELCTTPSKRAKTIVGLCVGGMDDVFDPTPGGLGPNPSVNFDELVRDDDDVPPEVTRAESTEIASALTMGRANKNT